MLSVIIIGMRGAGKSSLGQVGAQCLGWPCIDMDQVLEQDENMSCGEIVEKLGWEGFREVELRALEKVLREHKENAVISCGGGIVETEMARKTLMKHDGPVVHVDRNIEDIVSYLEKKEEANQAEVDEAETLARRPKYGESIREVYARRVPLFEQCRTHCFSMLKGDNDWARLNAEFETFFSALYVVPTPDLLAPNCWLLKENAAENIDQVDGVIVDSCTNGESIAKVRRSTSLPIVIDARGSAALGVLGQLHLAPYIIVSGDNFNNAPRWAGTTKFIRELQLDSNAIAEASSSQEVLALVESAVQGLCKSNTSAVLIKRSMLPVCASALLASQLISFLQLKLDGIAIAYEVETEPDGVSALIQSLVSSSLGPLVLSSKQSSLNVASASIGATLVDHYCLFGHPIQLSPSPSMHNAGFKALGLSKKYTLCDSLDVERVGSVIRSHRFRGASVTIPHKEVVHRFLDRLTDAASQIGAVNTVIKQNDGSLVGDNTDWFGIYNLLRDPLSKRSCADSERVALVVGAGGTALAASYCVVQLGLKLFVYNRTVEKAQKVADKFGGVAISDFTQLERLDAVIGTVPATSKFEFPNEDLLKSHKPVVFDAAYRPRRTALLIQAENCGCQTFEGIDMLVEQGIKQMELWTGGSAPREEMNAAARKFYDETDPAKKAAL